jgi:predicted metal-dependent phosphoesterase TrpH
VAAGLDALEVFHSDHDDDKRTHYGAMALEHGLLMTGGTDFHADPASSLRVGTVTLPPAEWERLAAARRHRPS